MIKAKKYRKKPVAVEAFQWRKGTHPKAILELPVWACEACLDDKIGYNCGVLWVQTLEGRLTFNSGDYIVRGVKGELYPVRKDIFEETYEEVEDND